MLQYAIDFLQDYGIWGLFLATAIEASSLPFPGAFFMLFFGLVVQASAWQMVLISLVNSLIFTLFSLIPYWIGTRVQNFSRKKIDPSKVEKAQEWFQKYGAWSIAISRPLSIGNYISYIAGLSNIPMRRYALFTFIGTFPWSTFLLFVGRTGSVESLKLFLAKLQQFGWYVAAIGVAAVAVWGFFVWRRAKKKKEKVSIQHENV